MEIIHVPTSSIFNSSFNKATPFLFVYALKILLVFSLVKLKELKDKIIDSKLYINLGFENIPLEAYKNKFKNQTVGKSASAYRK